MNKFTKLLSVFVIAGAVSAGVATLAGCGPKHVAEKHEAVAATCTQTGTKEYYTCSEEGCKGKYYQDEACTIEVTMEDLTIAALGHSATKVDAKAPTCTAEGNEEYYTCSGDECEGKKYTDATCTTEKTSVVIAATGHTEKFEDNGDGTHKVTCEKGDLTATNVAHVDEDDNGKCDKCEALFFAAGKFYNASNASEFEILANSKIIYNNKEYTLSAVTEDETTKALSATFTITIGDQSQVYTLTKTETGYTISYEGNYGTITKNYLPMPEIIAEDMETFAGVYEGTLNINDNTVTRISITMDGYVLVTQAAAEGDPVTTIKNATSVAINYNTFSTEGWSFVAKTAENNVVKTIEITYNEVTATFTRTSEAVEEVPEALPVDEFTYYTTAADAETSYTFIAKDSTNYYRYMLNDKQVELISGNDTNGYLIKSLDSNYDPINYLLKVSADKSSIEVYAADKTTKLATLTLQTVTYPTVKVDGTENTNAVTDVFNANYAYYKIENAGWYTFTAGSAEVWIYTAVDNHQVTNYGETALQIASGKSKTVYLEANSLIAVDDYYKTDAFTAAYSETEPVVVIEYASFTGGKYEIASFDGSETYYVKGTVATAGKYYVTVTSSERTESGKECLVFDVNGVEYGSYYDTSAWRFVVKDAGLIYSADLAVGTEVRVALSTPNSSWSFGKVTVYFETEEEYNARLNGGSSGGEEETDLFSTTQIGTYVYNNVTYVVAADSLTVTGPYNTNEKLTLVSVTNGVYTFKDSTASKLTFSFNSDGNMEVTSDNVSCIYKTYVAEKQTSSGGSGEESGSFEGFTADQQGTYVYEFDFYGTACVITITLQDSKVYYNFNSGKVQPDKQLEFVSLTNGTYKFSEAGNAASYIEFTLGDGAVVVSNNQITLLAPSFTATKPISGGGETTGNPLSVGENTINVTKGESVYTFTATEAGTYVFTYGTAGDMSLVSDGGSETVSSGSSLVLTAGQTIELAFYMADWSEEGTYTLTIALDDGYAKAGENTIDINAMNYGVGEITLNKVGVWTIEYDATLIDYITLGDSNTPIASGATITVTDTAVVIVVHAKYNDKLNGYAESASFTLTLTSGSGEALEQGGESTDDGLKVGENTINVTKGESVYTFTATEAGTYVFTYGTAGDMSLLSNGSSETVSSGDSLVLTAGQTIELAFYMADWSEEGTYTLTIAKA